MRRLLTLLPLVALLIPATATAEDAWLTQAVEALRWPDAEQVSVQLEAGDKVVVIYRTESLVRVRKDQDDKFGWVPQDALTDQAPAAAVETALDAWEVPDMPDLELPKLGEKREATPMTAPTPAAPAGE